MTKIGGIVYTLEGVKDYELIAEGMFNLMTNIQDSMVQSRTANM